MYGCVHAGRQFFESRVWLSGWLAGLFCFDYTKISFLECWRDPQARRGASFHVIVLFGLTALYLDCSQVLGGLGTRKCSQFQAGVGGGGTTGGMEAGRALGLHFVSEFKV